MPGISRRWKDFDLYMLVTTVVLMGFSTVSIWSAAGGGAITPSNLGVKQGLFGAVGLIIMVALANIDYRFFATLAWPLYAIGLGALALVLVPGIGYEIQGARRWFDFQVITVQPSEFVKLATIIVLAAFVSSRGAAMKELGNFLLAMAIVALPSALIAREPDLDATVIFGVIWASMMLVTRTRMRYFVGLALLTPFAGLITYRYILQDFHRNRIMEFLKLTDNGQSGLSHADQAAISIGSGGLLGLGLPGSTRSQLDWLPVRTSDFVFAHASAMFGFIGMMALFAAMIVLLWRCLRVVEIARDSFGQCLALGVTGIIFVQAVVNIGMNVGLLPVAGIPLPFVSQGLSSLWTFLFAEGILQSIRMHHRKLAFQPD